MVNLTLLLLFCTLTLSTIIPPIPIDIGVISSSLIYIDVSIPQGSDQVHLTPHEVCHFNPHRCSRFSLSLASSSTSSLYRFYLSFPTDSFFEISYSLSTQSYSPRFSYNISSSNPTPHPMSYFPDTPACVPGFSLFNHTLCVPHCPGDMVLSDSGICTIHCEDGDYFDYSTFQCKPIPTCNSLEVFSHLNGKCITMGHNDDVSIETDEDHIFIFDCGPFAFPSDLGLCSCINGFKKLVQGDDELCVEDDGGEASTEFQAKVPLLLWVLVGLFGVFLVCQLFFVFKSCWKKQRIMSSSGSYRYTIVKNINHPPINEGNSDETSSDDSDEDLDILAYSSFM
ncbi:hypothetical protein P9112_005944 [Eukaryota sp. TZLM1-RC]